MRFVLSSYRIERYVAAELFEYLAVNFAKATGNMYLASVELRQGVECTAAQLVMLRKNGQSHKYLVGVEARVASMEH